MQVNLTNTNLPNMYRRSTTEPIMHPMGQNILLIYPHFGISLFQPTQSLNSEDLEIVKLVRCHFIRQYNVSRDAPIRLCSVPAGLLPRILPGMLLVCHIIICYVHRSEMPRLLNLKLTGEVSFYPTVQCVKRRTDPIVLCSCRLVATHSTRNVARLSYYHLLRPPQ